jgi:branched-chain amino acid transport system permease protein
MFMTQFLQQMINGLSLGSIYALVALGYTMVYGIIKLINFAHGDIYMLGAYIGFIVTTKLGLGFVPALLISMVGCAIIGMTIERIAYKPLRHATRITALITAIGVSYLLQSLAQIIFGTAPKMVNVADLGNLSIGGLTIPVYTLVTLGCSVVIMAALTLFVKYTRTGRAMIAVSEDKGAAQLMGINVNGTIALTFAIGSALAAIAGILLCSTYPSLTPYTGSMPGIKAFVAAVFGGIGSIPGALIGGILLGVIEILSKAYISSQLSDAIVFAVLIVVLLVNPTGLLGKNIQEKV